MIEIEWIGNNLTIPKYCVAEKGDVFSLPNNKATSFVDQGLAKYTKNEVAKPKPKPKPKTEENN